MTVCLLVMKNIEIEVKLIFGHITAESIFQYCLNLLYWMVNITIQYQHIHIQLVNPMDYRCVDVFMFSFLNPQIQCRAWYILTSYHFFIC